MAIVVVEYRQVGPNTEILDALVGGSTTLVIPALTAAMNVSISYDDALVAPADVTAAMAQLGYVPAAGMDPNPYFIPTSTVVTALTVGALTVDGAMTIRCDPTAGAFVIPLPSIASMPAGTELIVKNQSDSANTITLLPSGADLVDGAPSLALSSPRGSVRIQSDGVSDWMVVG